ncbi:ABC transporter substrate-binding protein [Microbacterium sp. NRRL B-14842]|uniref:ABC transporter substrate-binding protein n=1 Tax=Microbacterium sp. NRRL B-14842 TaxID=3162881 RepID=UPI003D2908C5
MSSRRITPVIALGAVALLALAGCSGGNSANNSESSQGSDSLVIDTAFSIETTDPGHTYDPTGNMIAKALYETLVDFEGSDVSTPVPGLASWEQNDEATEFTFTLDGDRVFSDGSPIEAKDVVFSLQRIQGMADAKPNFLLGGLTIEEVDDKTIRFTSETPLLQLPRSSRTRRSASSTPTSSWRTAGTTDGTDSAQGFLDGESAGSGPFVLDTLDLSSQVVLTRNDEYNGDEESAYSRVVVRNVSESATQLANLKGGDSMVAMDLNGDQVAGLGDDISVDSVPSGQTIFLLLNQGEAGGDLANVKIAEAIRYALDYDALLELAGAGAVQATGVIPPGFEGALDSGVEQGPRQGEGRAGGGRLHRSDPQAPVPERLPVGGVEFTPLAERIQAQLEDAGIAVDLAPAPFATELDAYVNRH